MKSEVIINPVVAAQLPGLKPHPYSSISTSPDGKYAILAGKDTLRFVLISPNGLEEVRSIRISQYFQTAPSLGVVTKVPSSSKGKTRGNLRDAFNSPPTTPKTHPSTIAITSINDVAWGSPRCHEKSSRNNRVPSSSGGAYNQSSLDTSSSMGGIIRLDRSHDVRKFRSDSVMGDDSHHSLGASSTNGPHWSQDPIESIFSIPRDCESDRHRILDDSLVAAAGSNGAVVVWRASDLLGGSASTAHTNSSTPASIGQPTVLVEHSRAVNRLAWHPKKPGLLLTASQDGTAVLLERRFSKKSIPSDFEQKKQGASTGLRSWFGGVAPAPSSNNRRSRTDESFSWCCMAKFNPNCGAILDIKWSIYNDDVLAMVINNGFLIVYNMHMPKRPIIRIAAHAREATTLDWHPTQPYTIATGGVDRTVKVWDLESAFVLDRNEDSAENSKFNSYSSRSLARSNESGLIVGESSPSSFEDVGLNYSNHSLNNLPYVPSSTWPKRPSSSALGHMRLYKNAASKSIHELSISAQVQCLKWRPPSSLTSSSVDHHDAMLAVATAPMNTAGGCGSVCLWSYHRPFMPLSVVEGHVEGAVTDFLWLDTPDVKEGGLDEAGALSDLGPSLVESKGVLGSHNKQLDTLSGTWQHILSVGRDGQCLLQSFARGERPIFQVPSSTFAVANLSPFQKGYGSLQLVSVHQNVPSGHNNDFLLSGLRSDALTSKAPGVFKEVPSSNNECIRSKFVWEPKPGGQREPSTQMRMKFSVTDSGDLDSKLLRNHDEIVISPEVVHLSRFAESYRLRKDFHFPTKASICRHNAVVANKLNCLTHERMWNMLASLLEGSGSDNFSDLSSRRAFPRNAMAFVLLQTLKSLLLERADAGDIQTCVVICEVMEIIPAEQTNIAQQQGQASIETAIPGLDYMLVREWYLSYIELLQQMCLFSHATDLIGNCRDPEVGKLNQQSTTINESCPRCYKPLQPTNSQVRACKNCRERVGLCFICHAPVKGMFVWCPGCGHGGHLECALEWFGGELKQDICPTGCGHKCNFVQHSSASSFPRTTSLLSIDHQ